MQVSHSRTPVHCFRISPSRRVSLSGCWRQFGGYFVAKFLRENEQRSQGALAAELQPRGRARARRSHQPSRLARGGQCTGTASAAVGTDISRMGCRALPSYADSRLSARSFIPIEFRRLKIDGKSFSYLDAQIVWPGLAAIAGLPATVAPIDLSDFGLPIGAQIIGPYLEDRTTIAFAESFSNGSSAVLRRRQVTAKSDRMSF